LNMTMEVTLDNFSKLNRAVKKSKKASLLADAAEKLFRRYGLDKVTVEEICRSATVSKMTFYRYFRNKIHLFLFILGRIMERAEQRYFQIMGQKTGFMEKARGIVQMKIELSRDISYQMLRDYLNSPYPEIREFVERKTREYFQLFLKDFKQAQQEGEIREDIKPEFILFVLNRLVEFASDENLLKIYASSREIIQELNNFFFFGILPPGSSGAKKQPETTGGTCPSTAPARPPGATDSISPKKPGVLHGNKDED